MAVVSGTITNIQEVRAAVNTPGSSDLQMALVLFTVSGTYAQADDGSIAGVGAAISAARRNGKTITLRGAMPAQAATKASDPTVIIGTKLVSVSTDAVLFTLTSGDHTTEHADATAVAAQDRPFGVMVSFTEA
jgi:hypothetical protein